MIIKKNIFGQYLFIKKWLIKIIGFISYNRFSNTIKISGSEIINNLPNKNVLFVSNHQTYFADGIAILHMLNASVNGRKNTLKNSNYLFNPKLNIYFIAAKETMNKGLIPKILSYTGSISIKRTWKEGQKNIVRDVSNIDISNIKKALKDGWVITFPQGTTKAWAPIRKGTAHIIKENKPIVVPIILDGFRRSFDKKGLFIKKKGSQQKMEVKKPLKINYEVSIEDITKEIGLAIHQDISQKVIR
ncbi:MAG: 1-acyl-sn-glycerol-3-phosphate acyltransferase [Flavobacteriales bacterium]|nr:1-acyl-sn-glycerol-3-phosphate acyltransferase [Flavobacteriales bacterium]|tara:strand:- start:1104 stop:1838 length:735 start_codon:yes stop_codon:yes gene_type:complete